MSENQMRMPEPCPYELAFRAESGDRGAQFQLGMLFLLGEKVEQDPSAAHRWITRAAEANHPGALLVAQRLAAVESKESPGRSGLRGIQSRARQACERWAAFIRRALHLPWVRRTSPLSRQRAGAERLGRRQKTASLVDAA